MNKISVNGALELHEYLKEHNLSFEDIEIVVKEKSSPIDEVIAEKFVNKLTDTESTSQKKIDENVDIDLIFLSDNPKITGKIGDHNILYVDDLIMNENICMPTKINLLGRSILINVCNEDGTAHTMLNIALDNKPVYNVLFELRKQEGNNFLMEVARDIIETKHD